MGRDLVLIVGLERQGRETLEYFSKHLHGHEVVHASTIRFVCENGKCRSRTLPDLHAQINTALDKARKDKQTRANCDKMFVVYESSLSDIFYDHTNHVKLRSLFPQAALLLLVQPDDLSNPRLHQALVDIQQEASDAECNVVYEPLEKIHERLQSQTFSAKLTML